MAEGPGFLLRSRNNTLGPNGTVPSLEEIGGLEEAMVSAVTRRLNIRWAMISNRSVLVFDQNPHFWHRFSNISRPPSKVPSRALKLVGS